VFASGSDITFEMAIKVPPGHKINAPIMGVVVNHTMSGVAGGINSRMTGYSAPSTTGSEFIMRCRLLAPPLLQGTYTADFWFGDGPADLDVARECLSFRLEAADVYGTGRFPLDYLGVMFLRADWETLELPTLS
jgi:hypothetical protein